MAPGCSLSALQWLIYVQENDARLINKSGVRVKLEHKYYRGEKSFSGWDIDGYAEVDGVKLFYEFLGCFFHKGCKNENCRHYNPTEIDERFERKKSELSEFGLVIVMRGCIWEKKISFIKRQPSKTFPDIYNTFSNEKVLIDKIRNDEIFGFVVADVTTPPEILAKILPLNFPPVIQRGEIDETMTSEYMQKRCRSRQYKFPQKTLIQTYNGKQLLIYTPTVQFYMQIGLKISNISKFIQYLPVKPLEKFVKTITNGRINAVKNKNESLGTAYKIIGNS